MKKYLITLLLFFFMTANNVFAINWIPITADSGKVAEIDIDSIEKNNEVIKYKIKQNKLEDEIIYTMVTNYANKTTAISNMSIYRNDKQIEFKDYSKIIKYTPIKQGTLNEAAYRILTLVNNAPALDMDKVIWDKYFKKYQRKIQRNWHPNLILANHYPRERYSIAYVTLIINKDGDIAYQYYYNDTNQEKKFDDFNKKLKEEIEKAFKKIKFKSLPKEYMADNVIVVMQFTYSWDGMGGHAKSQPIEFNDLGIGYIELGKNYSGAFAITKVLFFPLTLTYLLIRN